MVTSVKCVSMCKYKASLLRICIPIIIIIINSLFIEGYTVS
jgi:hypothetical protein